MNYLYAGMVMVGLILVYVALTQYQHTSQLLKSGMVTTAVVTDLIAVSDEDGTTYKPVFEYHDGRNTQSFTSSISSAPPAYNKGERVKIVYESRSGDVKILSYWSLYRWTIICLCLASPLLIIGGGYFLYTMK